MVERSLDGLAVIPHRPSRSLTGATCGLVSYQRLRAPDALNLAFRQQAIVVVGDLVGASLDELKLERGTSAVDHQYLHKLSGCQVVGISAISALRSVRKHRVA